MTDECHNCTLHQLPRKSTPSPGHNAPFVHRFFLLGLIGGFFGSAYLGVHLWLILHGAMKPWQNYAVFRSLHSSVQIFIFLGLFAAGFSFQAGPAFMGVRPANQAAAKLVPAAIIIGLIVTFAFPAAPWGMLICAAGFFCAAAHFIWLTRFARIERISSFGAFIVFGFLSLGAGAVIQATYYSASQAVPPLFGLFLLWGGIGSFVFAAAQKFISGSLDGVPLTKANGVVVFILHASTAIAILLSVFDTAHAPYYLNFAAVEGLLALACYAGFTRLYRAVYYLKARPMAVAMVSAFFWAAFGAAALGTAEQNADLVLHTWALGWFMTLIFAVSTQIIGHLSGKVILQPRTLLLMLWIWQLAPLGRGFGHALGSQLHWVTATAVSVVLIVWAVGLIRGIVAIETRSFKRKKLLAGRPIPA